jgi:hypothetical protein
VISYITTAVGQGAAKVSGFLFIAALKFGRLSIQEWEFGFFAMVEAPHSKRLVVALSTLCAARATKVCCQAWRARGRAAAATAAGRRKFFGSVCRGRYKGVGVAAKLLLQKADQSADELALLQEAARLADLRHRNIVSLFGLRARRFAFVSGEELSQ